jgi:hypothetical protein
MKNPNGPDTDACCVCGHYGDVAIAWQEALNVFGVCIGNGLPAVAD